MPLILHHWGFVVSDVRTGARGFAESLGASWNGRVFEDPHQRVRVTFLDMPDGETRIELVEPAEEKSPVSRFLLERGGGLHHVCYEVDGIEAAIGGMRAQGALIAKRPLPAVAFGGRHIAWVITREKLLVELLERKPPDQVD